jgi:hypothetical protein
MTPRAVISGRVVDEAGDPVQGVGVQTVPVTPGSTPVMLIPIPNPPTDDRGEFRLIGPAGKYYVQATCNTGYRSPQERPEKRSDGTSEAIYGTTFYPSSIRKERGTVVEAVAGKEVERHRDPAGAAAAGPRDQRGGERISRRHEPGIRQRCRRRKRAADHFEPQHTPAPTASSGLTDCSPAYYRVTAMYNDGKTQLASRSMEWQLENTEIANVELVLSPGLELTGSLKMEGEAAGRRRRSARSNWSGDGALSFEFMAATGGEVDGERGVPDRQHRAGQVPGEGGTAGGERLHQNAGNRWGGGDQRHGRSLQSGSGSERQGDAGQQRGADFGPGAGFQWRAHARTSLAMIFLARDPDDIPLTGYAPAHATPDGKYTIKAVVPGKYRMFALNAFDMSGAASAEAGLDMFKKLFERAEEIELKEGDRIVKDLKVMPMEDANAKPKK